MVLLPVIFAVLCQPGVKPDVKGDGNEAGAAWIKANAVAFSTSEAGHGFDDLKGLDAIVGDARIVSLGEQTHGTREAFQMKHRLLEYLVEKKGFSIFSIEANMPEAYALNEYVVEGKGDPKALIGGMYFWTWNTHEVLGMVEWMRAWNQKHPATPEHPALTFTGFDMQTPDVAAKIVVDFVSAHAADMKEKVAKSNEDVKKLTQQAPGEAGPFASATGTFPVEAARGKKMHLSAWIRTQGVKEWAGVWWRCDTPGGVKGFANMQEEKISGDTEWARHEFTIDVPLDTVNISFGCLLSGEGTAWFDDLEIELDGVKYEDPKRFSFDFENDAVRYLSMANPGFAVARSKAEPHGGTTCLELRKKPEEAGERVDGVAVSRAAKKTADELIARREELVKASSAKEADWAIQNAKVVAQCASMFVNIQTGFNLRDRSMAANVQWILEQNPGQKIVLWAHNGHVSRAGYMGMNSMGGHLSRKYGKEMVVFGFATGTGKYTAGTDGGLKSDNELEAPSPESVEGVFALAGLPRAIVDLRKASKDDAGSSWATMARPMRSIGAVAMASQFYPCTVQESYDVLVWQEATTASRPLGK